MHVVWFKRDLRIADHAPLAKAAREGRCLCLYVYEPEWWESPDFDVSHLQFVNESLRELDQSLRRIGGQLVYRVGRMPEVLQELHQQVPIEHLWSHQETGNGATYERDRRVKRWCRKQGIPWTELPQNGVLRGPHDRNGWAQHWKHWTSTPQARIPESIVPVTELTCEAIRTPESLGLAATTKQGLQLGGESLGQETLHDFLHVSGEQYRSQMSSPVTATTSCSRLSPYLAWGNLSIKQVVQATQRRQLELQSAQRRGNSAGDWLGSLTAFHSRLSWHCHFIQKLEDEPAIEFENMSRVYDGLREGEFRQSYFDAWSAGQTGYPMVDACMRALHAHSWINFRMRAMLVSFAAYHLWLHWRPVSLHLARHFLDYEPGIHYSQVQMQSGTTGINALRIYSPTKQVLDQDPSGEFIRQYVPELAEVPREYLAEPFKMPLSVQERIGCRIGRNYPRPLVEHAKAYRQAQARLAAIRRQPESRQEAQRVFHKHGSRRRPSFRPGFRQD